ncbi:MAG: ATP-binding cassette domain-containing protein [Bdellovibrionales bacterium]|nr:ATP-binding cassette domain-containing protein [Massilia sp.]
MAMTPMLHIDSLDFRFDAGPVFSQFSVTLEPGITWLRAPNGKGKTTLLRLAAGALAPQVGSIRLGDVDCARDALAYRLDSFFCGGDVPELPWLTVREFLDMHMDLYPAADGGQVAAQLAAFDIADVTPQRLHTLSLGQHKKVQLALALALPVRLLLLDEPFNGLDAAAIAYLRTQLGLRAAKADTCILLTSHVEPGVPVTRTLELD